MNITHERLKSAVDSVFVKGSYFYNEYLVRQLKTEKSFQILTEIIDKSGKTLTEALFILLAAIRYYFRDVHVLAKVEAKNSFQKIIDDHYSELVKIAVLGKVQGNTPDRALPIFEVLFHKIPNEEISIIELGASFGLIGSCLLHPEIMLDNDKYIVENQKLPKGIKKASNYIGIDINPPEKEWLLACFSRIEDAVRIENYINEIPEDQNFKLIKASAVGFSKLDEVTKFVSVKNKIVVITSFMLYQFEEKLKRQLIDEIISFCQQNNGHWIAQEVDISDSSNPNYYIDFDGKRIITLKDDKCGSWEWL